MKILFIFPNNQKNNWRIPIGIAYLISIIKNAGHDIVFYDSTYEGKEDSNLYLKIKYFQPQLVCISVMSTNFSLGLRMAEIIKKLNQKIKIIFGGIHATIAPHSLLSNENIDYICVGEGEISILKFLKELERNNFQYNGGIAGIWYKDNAEIKENGVSELLLDLDTLPFPGREYFDKRHIIIPEHGSPILSARGCPFICSYCVNPIYKKFYGRDYIRFRSVSNVISEMKEMFISYQIDSFFVQDETFFMNKKRVLEFCKIYKSEINLPFRCMGQASQIDEEILVNLKEAGCAGISIGIESGNSKIRKEILKRDLTDEQLIKVFLTARKLGIATHSFNIIGLPAETEKNIEETLNLNLKCKPTSIQFTIMTPFEGTEIRDIYLKNNWIKKENVNSVYGETMIETDTINSKRLLYLQKVLPYKYFFSNKYLLKMLSIIFIKINFKNRVLNLIKKNIINFLNDQVRILKK